MNQKLAQIILTVSAPADLQTGSELMRFTFRSVNLQHYGRKPRRLLWTQAISFLVVYQDLGESMLCIFPSLTNNELGTSLASQGTVPCVCPTSSSQA